MTSGTRIKFYPVNPQLGFDPGLTQALPKFGSSSSGLTHLSKTNPHVLERFLRSPKVLKRFLQFQGLREVSMSLEVLERFQSPKESYMIKWYKGMIALSEMSLKKSGEPKTLLSVFLMTLTVNAI